VSAPTAAPYIRLTIELQSANKFILRSIAAYYTRHTTYKGYEAYTYNADFGDMSQNPDLECFCTTPDTCLKKGVHDLTNCVGKKITLSN